MPPRSIKKPYLCPECGQDLEEIGAARITINFPSIASGHTVPSGGDGKEIDFIIDGALEKLSEPPIECANCGHEFPRLVVTNVFISPDFDDSNRPE